MNISINDIQSAITLVQNTINEMDRNQDKLQKGINVMKNNWNDSNGKAMQEAYREVSNSLKTLNEKLTNNVKPKLVSAKTFLENYEKAN